MGIKQSIERPERALDVVGTASLLALPAAAPLWALVPAPPTGAAAWPQAVCGAVAIGASAAGVFSWLLLLASGAAVLLRRRTGTLPAWAARLPRRWILLCGVLAGLASLPTLAAPGQHDGMTLSSSVVVAPRPGLEAPALPSAAWATEGAAPRTAPARTAPPEAAPDPSPDTRRYVAPRATAPLPRALGATHDDAVIVRPGDTLWAIAARTLGPHAGPAQITREWHRWYEHNREVVGNDPDLLPVGLRLLPPR